MVKRLLPALGAALLAACGVNEIRMPEKTCMAPLRKAGPRQHVSFDDPRPGQISVYRRFLTLGGSLVYTQDTLLAVVGAPYPEAFTFIEHECRENYLAPDQPAPYAHVLQKLGGNLRPSGYTLLLPYDGYVGFELHPQGPVLDFQGLRPPENLNAPLYGRIVNFALGEKVFDSVVVRVEKERGLRYWIYSAQEGPLLAAQVDPDGGISGWMRVE
jgi:hypothetical protein